MNSRAWGRACRARITPLLNRLLVDSAVAIDQRRLVTAIHQPRLNRHLTPSTAADRHLLAIASRLAPTATPLHGQRRIGGAADGGYVMADALTGACALSIGIGWDDSWDEAALQAGVTHVWQFDHTVERAPRPLPGTTFTRLGVSARDERPGAPLIDLDTMWTIAGRPAELVVKMDVEGAEWRSLAAASDEFYSATTQWVMEWHDWSELDDPDWIHLVEGVIDRLSLTHALTVVTANNAAGFVPVGTLSFPTAIEVTWVRHDLVEPLAAPLTTLHNPLAALNDPRLPAINLDGLLL